MRRREFVAALGATTAWPLLARAQQQALPVVGFVGVSADSASLAPFRKGIGEQGYVEGQNVEILYKFAETQTDLFPLVADLVRRRVAVIVAAVNIDLALAAKSATATIPIVFTTSFDPVAAGLVASLNRPGGNVTGFVYLTEELTAKRLELLHEIVPAVTSIGFLHNPTTARAEVERREAENAARILGVGLTILNATTPNEIDAAFARLAERRIGALLLGVGRGLFFDQRYHLAALAARYAVPAIYILRQFVEAGGLMSYGPNVNNELRLAGSYVGRILKGEKPADLPVQRSRRIEMILNRKVAKALGIDPVPKATLLRADEVIE
jgi:putative ABC transport system substrate-binding protein